MEKNCFFGLWWVSDEKLHFTPHWQNYVFHFIFWPSLFLISEYNTVSCVVTPKAASFFFFLSLGSSRSESHHANFNYFKNLNLQSLLFPPPQLLWTPDSKSSQMLTLSISLLKKDTQNKNYVRCWEKMWGPKKRKKEKSCVLNNVEQDVKVGEQLLAAAPFTHTRNFAIPIQQPQ